MKRIIFCSIAMLVLAACAGAPSAPGTIGASLSAEELVAKRSKERWDLMIAGRLGEAYDYLTPGARSEMSREEYVNAYIGRPVRWLSAKVERVECEDEEVCRAEVMLTIETQMPMVGAVQTPAFVQETWLRVGGGWFRLPSATR